MVRLTGVSAYVPQGRLALEEIARQWGAAARPGARAVAAHDEDALTLAVAAATAALPDGDAPDAIWFASTSAPYVEKQSAATLAAAIDAGRAARTTDVGASLRGWTGALVAAADAIAAGSAARALVATGELRPAAPESVEETAFGDGGGAAVLEADGDGAELLAAATVNDTTLGTWRRSDDRFVQHGEQRFAARSGQVAPAVEAAAAALERAGVAAADVATLAIAAAGPRVGRDVAARLGTEAQLLGAAQLGVGDLGAALPAALLSAALDAAEPGRIVLLIATGDGADALVLRAGARPRGSDQLARAIADGRPIRSYASYLARRGALPLAASAPRSSPVAQRRDEAQTLRLHGMRCGSCGRMQYPIAELCAHCASTDVAAQPLARTGAIHTYTTDHIVAGINPGIGESPITMAVVDLDDGARAFLQLTDVAAEEVAIGGRVELCFRLLHDGSGYHNYYWKARPASASAEG